MPIILKDRKENQWYVEPFVGGGNSIEGVEGKRIGSDISNHLIQALILIRDNPDSIPDIISEDDYTKAKRDSLNNHSGIIGFIGFAMSYGGKWFGGYRRDVSGTKGDAKNMKTQTRRSKQAAIEQSKKIKDVIFKANKYDELAIPKNSIVYCDPPYANSTKYQNDFDHNKFWDWCRVLSKNGHKVFISEYSAPSDFECLWEMEVNNTLARDTGSKKGIEKLFTYNQKDI